MPFIQLNDQQFPLRVGEVRVGTGPDAHVRLSGSEAGSIEAIVELTGDNHVAIRRATDAAVVRVNGVQLGVEPTPLIHGDKIEIGGQELLYADDRKGGSTQFVSADDLAKLKEAYKAGKPAKPTSSTGGRLVSLVDGREYGVPGDGLTIGRDAGCDVVVPSTEVSRRHAEIRSSPAGYVLSDMSTNGVFVNGTRIAQPHTLGRGDVLRVGNEEFRFYADAAPAAAAPAAAVAPVAAPAAPPAFSRPAPPAVSPHAPSSSAHAPPVMPPAPAAAPAAPASPAPRATPMAPEPARPASPPPAAVPAAAEAPAAPAMAPIAPPTAAPRPAAPAVAAPAAAPTPARGALAALEVVNEGLLKGSRFEIRSPLAHVGRGAHNDIVVPDDSVSDSHAKIQKREAGWFVVDMGSTNGTYAGGRRIEGEMPITSGMDLRFGGVKMQFRTEGGAGDEQKGTRAIAGISVEQARRMTGKEPARPAPAPAAAPRPAEPAASSGMPAWVWIAMVVVVAAAAFFILQGR